jgi:hypothetical protein
MKSGRAALFADRVIRFQDKHEELRFNTWSEFRQCFIAEFCPKNEAQIALTKLETTTYHQNRKSVDEYVDEFRELIEQAGYTEGLAIVIKFRRGLNRKIQDTIANLPIGRPGDNDPDAWYEAAVQADENRQTNELFHGGTSTPTPTPKSSGNVFTTSNKAGSTSHWTPRAPSFSPARPPPTQNPMPMEIDAMKKKSNLPDTCRRCGGTGHWSKDCPQRFDIRYMSSDKREEWMQEFALQADTEEVERKEEEGAEDFSESSG